MSFRDLAPTRLAEPPVHRSLLRSPPPVSVVRTTPMGKAREAVSPSPTNPMDQISFALHEHSRDRHILKEKSLMHQSTTVVRYPKQKKVSTFSKLNDEIVSFQKMVNELKTLVGLDMVSPEEQWRIHILLKSLQDQDSDLMQQFEESQWNKQDLAVKASFSKLKRDCLRVRGQYRESLVSYKRKQMAEAAVLMGRAPLEQSNSRSGQQQQKKKRGQVQIDPQMDDDFFTRAMNEEENMRMNAKMHKVNEIYADLGKLVQNQQEQFDNVEDQIRYARANAEVGLEHLQQSRHGGMCGADEFFPNVRYNSSNLSLGRERRERGAQANTINAMSWSTPFETMGSDWMDVKKDLMDLMGVGMRRIPTTCSSARDVGARCSSKGDVGGDDFTYATGSVYTATYAEYSDGADSIIA